jgi:hypothetical protein
MSLRIWIRLAAFLTSLVLGVAIFQAWRADRLDRTQLAQDLTTTRQELAQASERQKLRDAQMETVVAQLEEQKRLVTTPAQIVRELPRQIGLPAPLVLGPAGANVTIAQVPGETQNLPEGPIAKQGQTGQVLIPDEDLKPLYDFALDCKVCQARLGAAQSDLADEKLKTEALRREQDNALRIARGGGTWRRVVRAAKWFVIGAAAGAVAARAAH